MRYTVIGVWDHEGDDDTELIIAGVVAGDVPLVDTGDAWYDATINTDTPHPRRHEPPSILPAVLDRWRR